jgi:hypothetical protein
MSSQQKRGFRLPWGTTERVPGEDVTAVQLDSAISDPATGVDDDDLGEGPSRLADASPMPTTEEAPASSDVREDIAEATMMDTTEQTESPTLTEAAPDADEALTLEASGAEERPVGEADADETAAPTWPEIDRRSGARRSDDNDRGPIFVVKEVPYEVPARREKPLVAGLVKAMREAAVATREETISRLRAEAGARVEGIRSRATAESAELRKRADADITEIREWSKAEVARVRQETEERIEARKAELAGETERHSESVEQLVAGVQSVVERFQADMDGFFERLLTEDDPATLASLALQAPDAPDLSGDGPPALELPDDAASDPVATVRAALAADAAAAAELAASEGLDLGQGDGWPAATVDAPQADEPVAEPVAEPVPEPVAAAPGDDGATRLLVRGLGSVAGISALKGALGQLPGVHAVSVSSGEHGEFVFAVSHDPGVDLATGIAGLPGFAARITDATDDGIAVVAHEPAS